MKVDTKKSESFYLLLKQAIQLIEFENIKTKNECFRLIEYQTNKLKEIKDIRD